MLKLLSVIKYVHICSLGEPQDSGISLQTVLELGPTIPIFGVCMGLQCIGEAFGGDINLYTMLLVSSWPLLLSLKHLWHEYAGKIIRAPSGVMHGKSSPVYYDEELGKALFNGLPKYGLISEPFNHLTFILFVIVHYSYRFSWLVIVSWSLFIM